MKILIGCETSGIVRRAFEARGHDVWSCDLLPAQDGSNRHIQDDIRRVIKMDCWDLLMVAHPPCTRLCNSGVRWLSSPPSGRSLQEMWDDLRDGAALFSDLLSVNIDRVAIENPVMHKHAKALIRDYRPFSQSVHPWQFADDEHGPDNVKKRTCFWLKGLPCLVPTGSLDGLTARADIHRAPPVAMGMVTKC